MYSHELVMRVVSYSALYCTYDARLLYIEISDLFWKTCVSDEI
jgi:hypothetical protein